MSTGYANIVSHTLHEDKSLEENADELASRNANH